MSVGTALLGLGGLGAALHIVGSILIVFGQVRKAAHGLVPQHRLAHLHCRARTRVEKPLFYCAGDSTCFSSSLYLSN